MGKKYGFPMENALENLEDEKNRKRVENFVIKNFTAVKNNRSKSQEALIDKNTITYSAWILLKLPQIF